LNTKIETVATSAVGINSEGMTRYLASRVIIITLLLGGASVLYWQGQAVFTAAPLFFSLFGLSYFQALVSLFLLRWVRKTAVFTQLQLVWDLLFVAALIVATGGRESVFSFAFLLVIVSASLLLNRRETFFAASSAVILYGGLLDLEYFGYLGWFDLAEGGAPGPYIYAVFVHTTAFLLTALLSGALTERWRRSEERLQRKQIDYEELARLNQTIMAHMSSGLLMLSRTGRVRSINRSAAEILGVSLEDVYDSPVARVLPDLPLIIDGRYNIVNRAEGVLHKEDGNVSILGYAATPVSDRNGEDLGLLVTFQDLTGLKQIEAELQRADRLAAVGRLASGMAHEIRNPLASISGSVQLLLEGHAVADEDRHLMSIVVREADRLSALLTDFLLFARPKPPDPEELDVSLVVDELAELLNADSRFARIQVEKDCSRGTMIKLDRSQIRQALWDLAINAAEAMKGEGILHIGVPVGEPCLYVEDSGPGVSEGIRHQVFDPFFSTKEKGTGLGLATVYSIVEGHGGTIRIKSGESGGARFELCFAENNREA